MELERTIRFEKSIDYIQKSKIPEYVTVISLQKLEEMSKNRYELLYCRAEVRFECNIFKSRVAEDNIEPTPLNKLSYTKERKNLTHLKTYEEILNRIDEAHVRVLELGTKLAILFDEYYEPRTGFVPLNDAQRKQDILNFIVARLTICSNLRYQLKVLWLEANTEIERLLSYLQALYDVESAHFDVLLCKIDGKNQAVRTNCSKFDLKSKEFEHKETKNKEWKSFLEHESSLDTDFKRTFGVQG